MSEATPAAIDLTGNRDLLIQQWLAAKQQLDSAKEIEAALRGELVTTYFDNQKEEGTENLELGNGYKLKAVKKLSYRIDKNAIDGALDAIEKLGEEGKFIAGRLVKWQPELSVSEFKKLQENASSPTVAQTIVALITPVLTITPGMPSLEFVEPKARG